MTSLDLGISSCPNDTFIFYAMIHNRVDTGGLTFVPRIYDVEELNQTAFDGLYPITKLSFYAWLKIKDRYDLLDSGAALGYGCGPLLVGRTASMPAKDARIVVPGEYTTAHLLLKLFRPEFHNIHIARFDTILPAVRDNLFDAGLIIHEGRFVFPDYGLKKIIDLGEWWEEETGAPIPLGCIAFRRDLDPCSFKRPIESIIKSSVLFSQQNPSASRDYVKQHAQETDDQVIDRHIRLYVNRFTLSLGEEGRRAVAELEEMAACKKIL